MDLFIDSNKVRCLDKKFLKRERVRVMSELMQAVGPYVDSDFYRDMTWEIFHPGIPKTPPYPKGEKVKR